LVAARLVVRGVGPAPTPVGVAPTSTWQTSLPSPPWAEVTAHPGVRRRGWCAAEALLGVTRPGPVRCIVEHGWQLLLMCACFETISGVHLAAVLCAIWLKWRVLASKTSRRASSLFSVDGA